MELGIFTIVNLFVCGKLNFLTARCLTWLRGTLNVEEYQFAAFESWYAKATKTAKQDKTKQNKKQCETKQNETNEK